MGPKTYMLGVDEILYQKELSSSVETLLLCAFLFFCFFLTSEVC